MQVFSSFQLRIKAKANAPCKTPFYSSVNEEPNYQVRLRVLAIYGDINLRGTVILGSRMRPQNHCHLSCHGQARGSPHPMKSPLLLEVGYPCPGQGRCKQWQEAALGQRVMGDLGATEHGVGGSTPSCRSTKPYERNHIHMLQDFHEQPDCFQLEIKDWDSTDKVLNTETSD